jgi:AAA family ATP:ADP antiporter
VPRVLKLIPDQRSVNVLLDALDSEDLPVRPAVLKGLNCLRESAPGLRFNDSFVTRQIYQEARYYFELNAALAPLVEIKERSRSAAGLLARTIGEQLRLTLERIFRLLALRYSPTDIYSAYLAISRRAEEAAAAVEFLDSVLDRDLKKILLPLLDTSDNVPTRGHDLFGVEIRDTASAVRELIRARDPWLAASAMAAAAELGLRDLAPEIAETGRHSPPEVTEVARFAELILA